jgi:hypothetical protein
MTVMRAKMQIDKIDDQYEGQETLYFRAVCATNYPEDGSDENNTFARFTPNAHLSMTVCNPALLGMFEVGEQYYLDFTKAE